MYSSWKCKTSIFDLPFTSKSSCIHHQSLSLLLCLLMYQSSSSQALVDSLFLRQSNNTQRRRWYLSMNSYSIHSIDASRLMPTATQTQMWIRCANVPTPRPILPLPSSVYRTMDCTQWNAYNGMRTVDEICTMKSARWNSHGRTRGSTMECAWWNLHMGIRTINLQDGIRTMESAR